MPIEIRELIISANVDSNKAKRLRGKGALKKGNSNRQEATVETAVEEVMRILKKKNNR